MPDHPNDVLNLVIHGERNRPDQNHPNRDYPRQQQQQGPDPEFQQINNMLDEVLDHVRIMPHYYAGLGRPPP